MDDHFANLAVGTVAQAPYPATSGTTLKLRPGESGYMPEVPFTAFIKPKLLPARVDNTEIVRVTAIDGDTLTIVRAIEDSSARPVAITWDFYHSFSAGGLEQLRDRHFEMPFTNQDTVLVTHNLGKKPAVTVIDSAGDQVVGDIKYNGLNALTLSFSSSFSGIVICN